MYVLEIDEFLAFTLLIPVLGVFRTPTHLSRVWSIHNLGDYAPYLAVVGHSLGLSGWSCSTDNIKTSGIHEDIPGVYRRTYDTYLWGPAVGSARTSPVVSS